MAQSWSFPPFRVDVGTRSVWRDEQLVPLSPKPFAVLATLVGQAGQVVTKEALFAAVWPETAVTEGVLKGCIRQIRRALGERGGTTQYIATVHRRGYRFIALVTPVQKPVSEGPSPASGTRPPTPDQLRTSPPLLVGREAELAQLHRWWAQARQGQRQVGFVTGEAGIGKTALVDAFVAQVAHSEAASSAHGQCIEHYGAGEAYLPLLEALGQLGRSQDGGTLLALFHQDAPSWLVHLPALVPEADFEALLRRAGGATQERMLRELAEAVEALTAERPLILVVEDLHWSDGATLDWLAYVARRRDRARLLVLGTYRPAEAVVHAHPVRRITQELQVHGQSVELALGSLAEVGVVAYLSQRFGAGALLEGLARVLHQRTEGNPLFLVTLVDELVRQGVLRVGPEGWELAGGLDMVAVEVPVSLRQLIERQLERLSAQEYAVLEAASIVGAEFSTAAVAVELEDSVEAVEDRCAALARRGQWVRPRGTDNWPDGTVAARYGFLHTFYCETLYDRVPLSQRARWHRQVGMRLEAGYGARAPEQAAELAEHFVRGRDVPRAVRYLQYVGETALRRSAYQEAITHLSRGLTLLQDLPDTPERTRQELDLLMTLGPALMATKGFAAPEVEQAYARARQRCQQLGETPQLFAVLRGLWRFYGVRAEFQTAQELGEQLLRLAQRAQDPALLLEAHLALGNALFWRGELVSARAHLEQAIALYDPQQHRAHAFRYGLDPGVDSLSYAAQVLWLLGYPDQAMQRNHEALTLAHERLHPHTLAHALGFAAVLHQFRREAPAAQTQAEAVMALASEQEFPQWLAWGAMLRGWVRGEQGEGAEGVAQMRQGLAAFDAMGAALGRPYWLALLAEASGNTRQAEEGLRLLAEAVAVVDHSGERRWEAELYRLTGEFLLAQAADQHAAAETCFQQALNVARQQQAKALELRAAMSPSRLCQQQGKRTEAYELLALTYSWFTEGFDTADLRQAKALLAALS